MTDHLIEHFADGIATFTMNRPDVRNVFSTEMLTALLAGLQRHATRKETRAVILTGAEGAFSAGGDVKGFAQNATGGPDAGKELGGGDIRDSFDQQLHSLRAANEISVLLHEMPKPTLAAIPGAAAGAGLSLALACDIRVATTDAKITTAFSKVGLSGDFGGSFFLTHLVGAAKARELYFSAELLSGTQAAALGIVNIAVGTADFEATVAAYAAKLANLPTVAVGYMKQNLNTALRGSLTDVLNSEAIRMIRTFETDDHKAAAVAFVEKRLPDFVGR
ncbi:MAG: enoyl-CoA hydratase [Rhodobiaceae bacterium]|nr:MAG: enoyl-CoA hydratase [Rhodobiaceae bacterium]